MRLTILMTSLFGGGAEHVGRSWARSMGDRGHEVRVLTLEDPGERALDLLPGIPMASLGTNRVWPARRRLIADAARHQTDCILSLQMAANLVNVAGMVVARGRRPVSVISERNIVSVRVERDAPGRRAKLQLARWSYRHADHMVAISHPVAAEMVSAFKVPPRRCTVVPNPAADPRKVVPAGERPAAETAMTLVVVGRLSAQKQPLAALDVANHLQRSGVTTRTIFVGDGPLRAAVADEARRRDLDVVLAGWQEDWVRCAPPGSVLLHTAAKEGFGNVLVEAAMNGIPSVARSSALGVADAVVPGMTGVLVASGDVAELARSCQEMSRIHVTGHDAWLARFSPENSAAILEQTLTGVLARTSGT